MSEHRPRKQLRTYRFRIGRRRYERIIPFACCALVLVICAAKLISYISDYNRSIRLSAELREIYNETPSDAPVTAPPATETPFVVVAATETPFALTADAETPVVTVTPVPTHDPLATMAPQPYPLNPHKVISDRFLKLRRQNADIIGWLTVGNLLSEAVVQRDNSYYLRRDYRGYHNTNGAIFLDEACDLTVRPHTLILYGHNMKTGAMFGVLRNYENLIFYHNNPFITFDSMYEDGQYVIFSVAEVSLNVQSSNYSGFYRLQGCTNMERDAIIAELCRLSKHTCTVDVNSDDQILLLVTCVGDESDRRIVAARRVRDGESESELRWQIQNSRSR